MEGKCRKSRYESSSFSDSEISHSSSFDTSDSDLDTSCRHKSHYKTGRSRHKKHRKHKKDRRCRSSSSDSSVSLDHKHGKHKYHSSKHHKKKHKHLKYPKHEQCKVDNGIYNRDRESGIRYDLCRYDMYSISDQDQSRYYSDRHLDRDTRNRYDKIATGIITIMIEISQEEQSIMVTIILIYSIIHTQDTHHNQKGTDIHT